MTKRFATNHSESFIRCFAMLSMTLPGTPILYYGDEINMVDLSIPPSSSTSRNQPMRGLMQWDNTPHGGFTNGTSPWISVGADFQTNNVKVIIPVDNLNLCLFSVRFGLNIKYPMLLIISFFRIRVLKGTLSCLSSKTLPL